MKPLYIKDYIKDKDPLFNHLLNEINWLQLTEARKEYFMSNEPLSYTYGGGNSARTYQSSEFTLPIKEMLDSLNNNYKCNYNVCFLNRYDTQKNALGWHADDSPEMNMKHDICVISLGAEREIYWKEKSFKGEVPLENKQLLHNGSLFIMPAGFQKDHYHKIPKCDKNCGVRISLTFRNYIK